jgi:hypothetical protein
VNHNDVVPIDPNTKFLGDVKLPVRVEAPIRIPVLIGEICYNLKSGLDYIVFELAKYDSRIAQDGTQFPIESTKQGFMGRKKQGWLKGINEAHIAAIKRLQPYKGCNWTGTLQALRNPDTHRELVSISRELVATVYVFGEDPNFDSLPFPVLRAPHPLTRAEVDVKIQLSPGTILFTDRTPVIETLEKLILNVTETIEMFNPEFQSG